MKQADAVIGIRLKSQAEFNFDFAGSSYALRVYVGPLSAVIYHIAVVTAGADQGE